MNKFEELKKRLGKKAKLDESLKDYTTLQIGGPAKVFLEVETEKELIKALREARKLKVKVIVIGEGSNLLVSEKGFAGLIIRNKVEGIKRSKSGNLHADKVFVKAGTPLSGLVEFAIDNGIKGFEKMVGIPGTVGGAIFGNAGAYGQTISDCLTRIKIFDGRSVRWLAKKDCEFSYRETIFKKTKAVILEGEFILSHSPIDVLKTSAVITLKIRQERYPPGMLCPGSFFKNVEVIALSKDQISKVMSEKIVYGKVPAGYLLESVGARGAQVGDIKIADYHANLFINLGNGNASDFYRLAKKFKNKVKKKFGIILEPEVQLIGFDEQL